MFSKICSIARFYYDGLRQMGRLGRKLWILMILKVLILFAVIKYLFFPNLLQERFSNDQQRSAYILQQLTQGD